MRLALVSFAALLAAAPAALAQTPQAGAERLDAFLDRFPDLGPGYAVVAVTADEVLLMYADGVRRASTGAPMTPDTPVYVASQTKAYMGLLAARLDAEGVLSLDSTLADHWPDLELPDGLDPADYTMRDLISHQVPIEAGLITLLEAYVTRVDPADYPALIAANAEAREPGYRYSNIGYNVYGAILETVTGRTWQDWLDEGVFDPLGLEHTSARTSDFAPDSLAWSHVWTGEDGWEDVAPKTDAQMQSAGGMMVSPHDMGVWLQTQLRGEGPDGSGLTREIVQAAQTVAAVTDPEENQALELPCSGYALGWNVCDFNGHVLYVHGGGYTGARTQMAFSPDLGVGIGVFSNSDNMTGWLTSRTAVQFLQYVTDHDEADRWSDIRAEQYPIRIERLLEHRRGQLEEARAQDVFGDWSWTPDAAALSEFAGVYASPDMYAPLTVTLDGDALSASWGDYPLALKPAAPDVFGGYNHALSPPETVVFERGGDGAVTALVLDGDRFAKR